MEGKGTKTKLRWITPGKLQQYLKECSVREASQMMKVRLHMVNIKGNYGGGTCRKCGVEEETTEHVLLCLTDGKMHAAEEWTSDVGWLRKTMGILGKFEE